MLYLRIYAQTKHRIITKTAFLFDSRCTYKSAEFNTNQRLIFPRYEET